MADQYLRPARPIFRDTPGRWQRELLAWGPPPEMDPVTPQARAIAVAVFYAAAEWSETYWRPVEFQICIWAHAFESATDAGWLTVDLAERAVHAHMRESLLGHLLPAHVIQGAAVLKLEGAS